MFLALLLALAAPENWTPARWKWAEPATLDLVRGTPVNCLLLEWTPATDARNAAFSAAANESGIAVLAVLRPGDDAARLARDVSLAKWNGVVLEGDFPEGTAARVRDAMAGSKALVIELTSRGKMKLAAGDAAPVRGTFQGVWPGILVQEDGHSKAGPTGGVWIDTNSGFIRSVRSYGGGTLWIGNVPPPGEAVTPERYVQVLCDAAIAGARWIVALDDGFSASLYAREPKTLEAWKAIGLHLEYFERHPEWRSYKPFGRLAIVQDVASGALLSGGILDMIAVKHTPVRPLPPPRLSPEALAGAKMAVNLDAAVLDERQREILRDFTRAGKTVLTAPREWNGTDGIDRARVTLEKAELERIYDVFKEVSGLIGRNNLGVRLFNVSTMLSNVTSSPDGRQVLVHLVNYSGFPVENVSAHFLGEFKRARLLTPGGKERDLEVYKHEEGSGVDIDMVSVCASLRLE